MSRKSISILVLVGLAMIAVLSACGEKPAGAADSALAAYFPEKVVEAGLERNSSVDTYVGDSLYAYIDGGAELYHEYGFELVSTASYALESSDIVLDIYQFKDSLGAFGLYSQLQPDWPEPANLGVESFASATNIDFVKGRYLVRLTTFEESVPLQTAMHALAEKIEQELPGTTNLPPLFSRFPEHIVNSYSAKYYANDYLEHEFLDSVYVREYQWGEKEFTLFLTADRDGQKRAKFAALLGVEPTDPGPFPDSESLALYDGYYGQVVAAGAGEYLVGIIGFSIGLEQMLKEWSDSLSQ